MATNNAFDRDKSVFNRIDNPSSNQGADDTYGTFSSGIGASTMTATTVSSYPYAMDSQSSRIMVLGSCPACKSGTLETDFTFLGICCAIFFFPIGIICCLAFRQRRCHFCGAIFP